MPLRSRLRRRIDNETYRHGGSHDSDNRKMYDERLCDEQSKTLNRRFEQRESDHHRRKRRNEFAYARRQTPYKHKYKHYGGTPCNRLRKIDDVCEHLRQKRQKVQFFSDVRCKRYSTGTHNTVLF